MCRCKNYNNSGDSIDKKNAPSFKDYGDNDEYTQEDLE